MLQTNKIHQGDCIEVMKEIDDNSIDAIITDPPYGIGFMGKKWDTFDQERIKQETEKSKKDYLKSNKINSDNPNLKGRKLVPIGSACTIAGSYDLSLNGNQRFQSWFFELSKEFLRILKPGGYLLSFGGTRTYHRLVCGIEDAGFEIRDTIMWLYGSGFPKSLNIGKAIDKLQGNEREEIEPTGRYKYSFADNTGKFVNCRDSDKTERKDVGLTKGTSEWEGWGTALKPACEPIVEQENLYLKRM